MLGWAKVDVPPGGLHARPAALVPILVVALAAPRPMAAEAPAISHAGVGCAVAEKFPRLEARIVPVDAVARAIVPSHRLRRRRGTRWP